jgi:uncharacterized membrane protein YdjX (TVP38/TMEM64 family)
MSVKPFLVRHHRLLILLLLLLLLLLIAQATGLRSQLTVPYLQQQLQTNPWSGLALFITLFCVGNMAQVPGWIFLAAAVLGFGRVHGGLATDVAANLSCLFTFVTIRLVGGNVAATLKSPLAQRLVAQLQAHPVRNVLLLRSLFQTLPALNFALALSGLRLRHYLLGTLLGLPLPIAVYCIFFDSLIRAAHRL